MSLTDSHGTEGAPGEIAKGNDKRWPAGTPDSKGGQFAPGSFGEWLDKLVGQYTKRPKGWQPHPKINDKGQQVAINYPSKSSPVETWKDPESIATFVPGGSTPASMHGVGFTSWHPPQTLGSWAHVPGQNHGIIEGPLVAKRPNDHLSTGVIIVEPDGRVWLTKPTNHYGGYEHTFPKGTVEPGISLQANAIKEAFEETGLKVNIIGSLGDVQRDTSIARMYVATRTTGTPADMGWESQAVKLVPATKLKLLLNRSHDKAIADKVEQALRIAKVIKAAGTPNGVDFESVIVKAAPPDFNAKKLAATNMNAPSHNAKLDKLAALHSAGDIKGILGLGFGTNNYAKQQVKVANEALNHLGSDQQVTHGTKPGTHPALKGNNAPDPKTVPSIMDSGKLPPQIHLGGPAQDHANLMAAAAKAGDLENFHDAHQAALDMSKTGMTGASDYAKVHEFGNKLAAHYGIAPEFVESEHPRGPDGKFVEKPDAISAAAWKGMSGAQKVAAAAEHAPKPSSVPKPSSPPVTADKPSTLTKPPQDYHWFNHAYSLAQKGDASALAALDPSYKTGSLKTQFAAYKATLQGEMGAGAKAAPGGNAVHDALDAVQMSDVVANHSGAHFAAQAMYEAAKKGDAGFLHNAIIASNDMEENATNAVSKDAYGQAANYGQKLQSILGTGAKAEAAVDTANGPMKLSDMTYAAAKPGGSNPGGLYKDKAGDLWLVKGNAKQQSEAVDAQTSDDRAKNEVLSAHLMKAAGIPAPEIKLIDLEGKHGAAASNPGKPGNLGVAVKMISDAKPFLATASNYDAIRQQFAVHAWLGNYDVMGMTNDNVMTSQSHGVINVDPGGSILFRAQGLKKESFGSKVTEWDSMRNPSVNPTGGKAFGPMTAQQLADSTMKVDAVKPDVIDSLVNAYGPGDDQQKKNLATILKQRRADIVQKGVVSAANAAAVDPEFETKHPRGTGGKFLTKPVGEGTHLENAMYAAAQQGGPHDIAMIHNVAASASLASQKEKAYAKVLLSDMGNPPLPQTGGTKKLTTPMDFANHMVANNVEGKLSIDLASALYSHAQKAATGDVESLKAVGLATAVTDNKNVHEYGKVLLADLGEKEIAPNNNFKPKAATFSSIPKPPAGVPYGDMLHANAQLYAGNTALKGHLAQIQDFSTNANPETAAYANRLLATFGEKPAAAAMKTEASPAESSPETKSVPPGLPKFDDYKLALTNSNAASVNAKLDKLKSLAESGDTKGLLALGFGSNNYAVTQVKLTNQSLAALGSPYQVAVKQKPNTHSALKMTGAAATQPSAPTSGTSKLVSVPESALPTKPDFANYKGPGQGLSSNAKLNESNQSSVDYVHQLAKNGDLDALKNAQYATIDPATGKLTGIKVPFYEHPSKHVQNYFNSAVDTLTEIKYPPKPLQLGKDFAATDWQALAREANPVPLGTSGSKIKDDHKFGFWFALGHSKLTDSQGIKPVPMSSAEVKAGASSYGGYSPTAKKFVSHVQSGGILGAYQQFKGDYSGQNLKALSEAAINAATPLKVGTSTIRWQNSTASMVKQFKLMPLGTVLQGNAPMPSSYNPDWKWGGGYNTRINFVAGPGAKAMHSHGSGSHSGEKEVTILPYQRFVLTKKQNHGTHWEIDLMLLPPTKP